MSVPDEVVDAELVNDDHLPATRAEAAPARPLVDRHTILRPNAPIPTTADLPTYTEADFRISEETAELLDEAPPENTPRTYNSAREQFRKWCQQNGRVHLPCTTATFVEYVGHLVRQDKSPSTIQVAMSAIRSGHADGQQPGTKEASEAVRKHARGWAQRRTPKKAIGIRTDMLEVMVATCVSEADADYPKAARDAALLTLGWGMLSRRSELAHLLIEQLTIGPTGIHVLVAFSKTDQAAKGTTTFVPANPDDPATCPVVRVRAWVEELRRQGVTRGPLFRHINRGAPSATGPGREETSSPPTPSAPSSKPAPSLLTYPTRRRSPATGFVGGQHRRLPKQAKTRPGRAVGSPAPSRCGSTTSSRRKGRPTTPSAPCAARRPKRRRSRQLPSDSRAAHCPSPGKAGAVPCSSTSPR
ncbi:hypothetical protein [Streptomyces brevispora]|uniref:hypothetical protein n=1 Tax=Streptomyces brevispora TaxID=887462 RepID=UPI0035D5B766